MNEHLARLKVAILNDKKKAGVLAGLVLVALIMWVRASLVSSGPSRARAESGSSATREASSEDASSESSGSGAGATGSEKEVVALPASPALQRDLFRPSPSLLPRSSQTDSSAGADAKSAIGNDETPEQQERMRRVALLRSVREEAERFRLRSVMVGANPIAVIERRGAPGSEGKVLRVGDKIDGFEVVRVERAGVLLSKAGVGIELRLSPPRER